MIRRMRLEPRVLGSRLFMMLWLTIAWVMLWGPVEIGTIVAGVIVAILVMVLLPLPRRDRRRPVMAAAPPRGVFDPPPPPPLVRGKRCGPMPGPSISAS